MTIKVFTRSVPIESLAPMRLIAPIGMAVILITTLASAGVTDVRLAATWAAIHLVTLNLAGVPALAIKHRLIRRGISMLNIGAVGAIGATVGVTKALLTATAEGQLGLSESWTENLLLRLIGAGVAGVCVLVFSAYADRGIRRLDQARNELVQRNVATRLRTTHRMPPIDLKEPLEQVSRLTSKLKEESTPATPEDIRAVVDRTIRPLSAAMWSAEEARYPVMSARGVVSAALQSKSLPAAGIALLWSSTAFTALAVPYGIAASATHTLSIGLLAYLVWKFTPRLFPRNTAVSLALIGGISVAVVTLGAIVAVAIAPGLKLTLHPTNILLGAVWMMIVVTGFSVFSGAREISHLIRRDLESDDTRALIEQQVGGALTDHAAQETAMQLHGEIQSKLLGIAAGLEHTTISRSQAIVKLEEVLAALNQLASTHDSQRLADDDTSVSQQLSSLLEAWEGIMAITISDESTKVLEGVLARNPEVLEIVREGLTNAHRHGRAKHIAIECRAVKNTLILEVHDDGYGPREGARGLGFNLIDRWTGGRWRLAPGLQQGSILSVELEAFESSEPRGR